MCLHTRLELVKICRFDLGVLVGMPLVDLHVFAVFLDIIQASVVDRAVEVCTERGIALKVGFRLV